MSNYAEEQSNIESSDLILGNNLIENKELRELQNQLAKEGDELAKSLTNCLLDQEKYESICNIYDKIINIYSKEIISEIK